MADTISPERRSWNMSRIRSKDTNPEKLVRSYLFEKGYRFRKNDSRYPGTPDIVLPKYKSVIFIHGCFWHRHQNCVMASTPKTNTDFWKQKFLRNVELDERNQQRLKELGWNVIVIWECEIKKNFIKRMDELEIQLQNQTRR